MNGDEEELYLRTRALHDADAFPKKTLHWEGCRRVWEARERYSRKETRRGVQESTQNASLSAFLERYDKMEAAN